MFNKKYVNNKKPPQGIYHLVNHHPPIPIPIPIPIHPGMHPGHPMHHPMPYSQPQPGPPPPQQPRTHHHHYRNQNQPMSGRGRGSRSGIPIKQIVEYSDVSSEDLSAPEAGEIESELSSFSDENGERKKPAKPKAKKPGKLAAGPSKDPVNNNNNNGEEKREEKDGPREKNSLLLEGVEDIEDDEDELNQIINNDLDPDPDPEASETDYSAKKRKKEARKSKRTKKLKKRKKKRSRSASSIESISDNPLEAEEEQGDCLTPPLVTYSYEKSYTPSKDNSFAQGEFT